MDFIKLKDKIKQNIEVAQQDFTANLPKNKRDEILSLRDA